MTIYIMQIRKAICGTSLSKKHNQIILRNHIPRPSDAGDAAIVSRLDRLQGGPSGRGQAFLNIEKRVALWYKKFILWQNF